MKITVCIGSSCHIKGSRQVVEVINRLIKEYDVQDKVELGKKRMTEEVINLTEELYKQIDFLTKLRDMAAIYGIDISKPAKNAKEAVQWLYFGYLAANKEQNGAAMSLGRVGTFIDVYLERDLRRGVITEAEAQELIDQFVITVTEMRDEYDRRRKFLIKSLVSLSITK